MRVHSDGTVMLACTMWLLPAHAVHSSALPALHVPVQALAQTDGYLRKLNVVKEAVDDTAGAAQMVAKQKLQVRTLDNRQPLHIHSMVSLKALSIH